jgi:dipeptidase D
MENPLSNLKPERLWYYFNEICQIPRPSKKEEKIREYLVNWGKSHSLETLTDDVGNVLIRKPATPGYENRKTVVLQSHMDMVCEKNSDVEFDFDHDPIRPRIIDGWVKATGTTLGADNGIGIATQLAILEADDIVHGPLECLITTDEETGLTGAFGLQSGFLKADILLNLDSEDDGELFIGCAGGKDTVINLPTSWEEFPQGYMAIKISVSGLKGGHSGDDINKGLGNANKVLNRLLFHTMKSFDMKLAWFDAGNLRNAIAREGYAIIVLPMDDLSKFAEFIQLHIRNIQNELQYTDSGLTVKHTEIENPSKVLADSVSQNLINSLYACPHGVIAMSAVLPGLVETSTNLASVKTKNEMICITTSQRSSIESAKDDIANMVACTFLPVGADVSHGDGYPGWTPNPSSEIVELTCRLYEERFGVVPIVRAIHAGLECGLIGEKYPSMDMVSFGPTIRSPHSPDERIDIETVGKFWDLCMDILKEIPVK